MLKISEKSFKTTAAYLREVATKTDKNGQKQIRIQDKYTAWLKVVSYHKKYRKLNKNLDFPNELKARPDIYLLEWFTRVSIVKSEKVTTPGKFEYYLLTQISYLLSDHNKYVDEYRSPLTEGEYLQMHGIYKTAKEAKRTRYTFLDLWSGMTYTAVEFEDGEARVYPHLRAGEELLVPEWLEPLIPNLTEEEWLEIWKSNPNQWRRRQRIARLRRWNRLRGTAIREQKEKTNKFKQQLRISDKKLRAAQKENDKRDKKEAAVAREISRATKKIISGRLGTKKATDTLNKIARMVNGETIDVRGVKNGELRQTIGIQTRDEILAPDYRKRGSKTVTTPGELTAEQEGDTFAMGTQQSNGEPQETTAAATTTKTLPTTTNAPPQEETMWGAYWKTRKR